MTEQTFRDLWGNDIILTEVMQITILQKHPEAQDFIHLIEQVLLQPDEVRSSSHDERTRLYYRYDAQVLAGKWLVVVVKHVEHHFVATLYATDRIKQGESLWSKPS